MTEEIGAKQNVWMRAAMGGRLGSRLSGIGLEEGPTLPSRLQGLAGLPWFECWVQRLKTEKKSCLLYTSPSPRDGLLSRMPSSA